MEYNSVSVLKLRRRTVNTPVVFSSTVLGTVSLSRPFRFSNCLSVPEPRPNGADRRAGCVAYATAHTNCLTHPAAGGAPTLLTPATKISSSLHGQRRRSPASRRTLPSVHKVDVFWPTYRLRQSHSSAAGVASRRVDNIIVYETNALRCVRRIPTSKLASDNVVRKDVQNCSVIILFDATEIYDDIAVCNEVAECI